MHVCMYACMHYLETYMHAYIHTYIHKHTHMQAGCLACRAKMNQNERGGTFGIEVGNEPLSKDGKDDVGELRI